MLTQRSVELNIRGLRIFSKVGFFPLSFNDEGLPTGTSQEHRKKYIYVLCLATLYWAIMAYRLIESVQSIQTQTKVVYTLPVHMIWLAGGLGAIIMHAVMFYRHRSTNMILMRNLLKHLPAGTTSDLVSIHELLIRYVALFYPCLASVLNLLKFILPNPVYSIHSLFPKPFQIPTFLLCELCESTVIYFWVSAANYSMFLQMLFLQRTHQDMKYWLHHLGVLQDGPPSETLTRYLVQWRTIQLRTFYFNRMCSGLTYTFKLLCMTVSIAGIFFCIKLIHSHPIIATFSGWIGASMWFWYIVLYDRAFKLPHMLKGIRERILLRWRMTAGPKLARFTRDSLWGIEVSMGGFHSLERCSTIIFLNFCIGSICNLLVSFPGQL